MRKIYFWIIVFGIGSLLSCKMSNAIVYWSNDGHVVVDDDGGLINFLLFSPEDDDLDIKFFLNGRIVGVNTLVKQKELILGSGDAGGASESWAYSRTNRFPVDTYVYRFENGYNLWIKGNKLIAVSVFHKSFVNRGDKFYAELNSKRLEDLPKDVCLELIKKPVHKKRILLK